MKRIKSYKLFKESLRSKMKGKSHIEIKNSIENIENPLVKFNTAIKYGIYDIVKNLLDNKLVDPIYPNNTPIIIACENGHLDIVKELLKYDEVDINMNDNMAIDLAAQNGHYDVVKYIIDNDLVKKDDLIFTSNLAHKNGYINIGKLIDKYISN